MSTTFTRNALLAVYFGGGLMLAGIAAEFGATPALTATLGAVIVLVTASRS